MAAPQIGIDITSALTQGGGIGRYTRELVRALVDLDSQNSYTLFSARIPSERLKNNQPLLDSLTSQSKITYRPAPLVEHWLYRLWYRLRLPVPVQLFSGRLDLFHSPDFVLPPISGDIPTLLTVHDLSFIHFPDTFPPVLVNYLNRVVPWSVSRAAHVLADSNSTKMDLMEQWAVPEDKITVLYSGVNQDYQPVKDPLLLDKVKKIYDLGDAPYLLSVGTIQPRKNYQMLIQAFASIAGSYPHNLFIAGGKGWLEDNMMAEAARQGIADRVRFLGFIADEHLPALYSAASLFLFPSLYEGFGLPVLEAMACGVPAVISNSSSLPEVGGEAALHLDPRQPEAWSEGMDRVLSDPGLAAAMVDAGFEQVQRFSWEKSAQELLDIYDSLFV
ncbi:MAG: glycosyltransferase family 4 protein [Candidatus Promineifilaceae bacterium]|jgi:glycosyltransferase involved in cell wall biosynthesis